MRVGFIGAGNMARALGAGLRRHDAAIDLLASDAMRESLEQFHGLTGGRAMADNRELVAASDVIVLSVKPQVMREVLGEIAPSVEARHLVISIAAGISIGTIEAALGASRRVVRAMPNTPALVGRGMSVLVAGSAASRQDLETSRQLLAAVGDAVCLDDETLLDAVTATSGSGPGFVFAFAEAMIEGAIRAGLAPGLADQLVKQTLLGAAVLWAESGEPAEELRRRVTSPGGTTQAGLEALRDAGFSDGVRSAILAATRRSRELSAG